MRRLTLRALSAVAACSETVAAPRSQTLTVVSINRVTTLPLVHYCTPAYPSTEQWVAAGNAKLTVYPDGTFKLEEFDETGNAQYHLNGSTKIYDGQSATGGLNGLAGTAVDAGDGSRTLRFDRATSLYADPTAFAGRLFRDSAVVTHVMTCQHPTAPDSSVSFDIVLE